jgi:hypothetical protein
MKFFSNTKQFFHLVIMTLIQQSMVAGSTYFLIKLTSSQNNPHQFLIQLFGFLACLTLVYFPVSMQKYLQDKWVLALQKKYLAQFRRSYQGRIDLVGNSTAENEKFGFMQREAFHVIDQVTFYWTDLLTTSLNVLLNIAVIGAALDSSFFGAYFASFVVYGILASLLAKYLGQWSVENQNARVAHASVLGKIWTTLLIGNTTNTQQLYNTENRCFNDLSSIVLRNRRKMESVQLFTTLMTMIPVIGLLVYLMVQGLQNPILLVPLIATLHRQIQIIQHIEVIGSLGLHYHSMTAIVTGFLTSLQTPEKQELRQRMKSDLIRFQAKNGRTLVTGPNGAGKSTWLKMMKEELGDNAVYLPAKMDIYFSGISDEMSSGQRTIAILKSIDAGNHKGKVFLLDEWDANLDVENRELLNQVVQKIAKNNLVYEVRHG